MWTYIQNSTLKNQTDIVKQVPDFGIVKLDGSNESIPSYFV